MLAPFLAGVVMVAGPTPEPLAASTPCSGSIAARIERRDDPSDGLSSSGVLLVLRNIGSADCLMPGLPTLHFHDAAGHGLDVLREPPPGMHPGPVVTPLALAPGAEASAALLWVGGGVSAGHHCVTPAELVIGEGQEAPGAPWGFGPVCGQPGRPIGFRQSALRAGPIPPPSGLRRE